MANMHFRTLNQYKENNSSSNVETFSSYSFFSAYGKAVKPY